MSSRFHPKSRQLFSCYFSDIVLQTDLLAAAVFGIAGGMHQLPAYFDNPVHFNVHLHVPYYEWFETNSWHQKHNVEGGKKFVGVAVYWEKLYLSGFSSLL